MGRQKRNKPRKIRRAPDGFVSRDRIATLADELADLSTWSVTATGDGGNMVPALAYGQDSNRVLTELVNALKPMSSAERMADEWVLATFASLALARRLVQESDELGVRIVWPVTHCIDWMNRTGTGGASEYRSYGGVGDFGAVVLAVGILSGVLVVDDDMGMVDVTSRGEAETRRKWPTPVTPTTAPTAVTATADPFSV